MKMMEQVMMLFKIIRLPLVKINFNLLLISGARFLKKSNTPKMLFNIL